MPAEVLLATRNQRKLAELRRILADVQPDLRVIGLDDAVPYEDVPETGATFADNAVTKARVGAEATGLITVADDSGLTVDALNGMPGVLSARWSGRHGDDPQTCGYCSTNSSMCPTAVEAQRSSVPRPSPRRTGGRSWSRGG